MTKRVNSYARRIRVEPLPKSLDILGGTARDVYIGRDQVGTYRYTFDPAISDTAEIDWVAVMEIEHRKGIGREIVQLILEKLREGGARHVVLQSRPESVEFWEKMGFKVREYARRTDVTVGMERDL